MLPKGRGSEFVYTRVLNCLFQGGWGLHNAAGPRPSFLLAAQGQAPSLSYFRLYFRLISFFVLAPALSTGAFAFSRPRAHIPRVPLRGSYPSLRFTCTLHPALVSPPPSTAVVGAALRVLPSFESGSVGLLASAVPLPSTAPPPPASEGSAGADAGKEAEADSAGDEEA